MAARVRSVLVIAVVLVVACAAPAPTRTPSTTATAGPTAAATPSTTALVGVSPPATSSPSASPGASCGPGCNGPATFVRHGSRATKVVALTFDDGFNIPACISIVDTLLATHTPATFFPNGQYVRENPAFWHWVAQNGFPVGNHTTTHNDPRTLSAAALTLNLELDRRIADAALGVPSINAYRPPYGDYDLLVQQVAGLGGYPTLVGWDVDSQDQLGAPSVAAEVANATTGTNGSIVLMHCGSALTPQALPAIIGRYQALGFSFVTVPQLLGLPAPTTSWSPPANPDSSTPTEVGAADPGPTWNASPAIDALGHLHVAQETPAGIEYGDDVQGSWQSAIVAPTTASTFDSRPSIALDPAGGVNLVYLSSTIARTQLVYQHRTSAGTWSPPSTITTLGAPTSTATVTSDPSGQPVVAYAVIHGAHAGITLARPTTGGWLSVRVPTTNGTFINPSIAIAPSGAVSITTRRNGYSDVDLTTNASGPWTTARLFAISGSAVTFAAIDPLGRLVVAAQETYGDAITLGTRSSGGSLTWTTVTRVGDLSGLAIGPDGRPRVAFSRTPAPGGPSRTWLAWIPAEPQSSLSAPSP